LKITKIGAVFQYVVTTLSFAAISLVIFVASD
jgi:hypothetical protein